MTAGNIPGRPRKLAALVLLTAALAVGLPDNGLADPPPWAPAHGWRQKQGQQVYSSEYAYDPAVTRQHYSSISRGTCDRGLLAGTFSTSTNNIVGSLLGGAVGGLVGNQFGRGSGRTAMTVLGAVAGALAGGAIGRSMEPPDQACIGQTLEHAPTNRTVAWPQPGQQRPVPGDAGQDLAGTGRRVLPRLPDQRRDRRPPRAHDRHGLPGAGRQLARPELNDA